MHIVVIDPAVETPEIDCFNHLSSRSDARFTYHLPAIFGFETLTSLEEPIHGIIVLGSLASVYDHRPWQKPLEHWLGQAIDSNVPVFGICYGHQMLAAMFGGKVEYAFPDQRKLRGVRRCNVNLARMQCQGAFDLVVTHNQIVTNVPSEFDIAATSSEVAIDGLQHKTKPIFSLQSHPEATIHFLKSRGMLDVKNLPALEFGPIVLQRFLTFCRRI